MNLRFFWGGFAIGMGLSADWLEEYTLECFGGDGLQPGKDFSCKFARRYALLCFCGGGFAIEKVLSADWREDMHWNALGGVDLQLERS